MRILYFSLFLRIFEVVPGVPNISVVGISLNYERMKEDFGEMQNFFNDKREKIDQRERAEAALPRKIKELQNNDGNL